MSDFRNILFKIPSGVLPFLKQPVYDVVVMKKCGLLEVATDQGATTAVGVANCATTSDSSAATGGFWSLVQIGAADECWPFVGHIDRDGYCDLPAGDPEFVGSHWQSGCTCAYEFVVKALKAAAR